MPDQLRADALGCFGGFSITPNIDALAARGVRFVNAYSQSSVCAPSRIAMQTGLYPHVSGHRSIAHLLQPHEPSLFRAFRDAGYFVAAPGARGDIFAPAARELSIDRWGYRNAPACFYQYAPQDRDCASARAFLHGRRVSEEVVYDHDEATIRTAEAWIEEGIPEPFVFFVGLFFPHPPFEVEEPWYSLHDRSRLPAPALADITRKPVYFRLLTERMRLDRFSIDDWRELRAVYAGMVSRADAQFGRIVAALDRRGVRDNMIEVFVSDHGEYLGDYGLVEKWPSGLDNCLVRNPLIISGPGVRAGSTSEAMVETIDVAPTLAELGGVPFDHAHFGRCLTHILRSPSESNRRLVFSEGGFSAQDSQLLESAPFPYDLKSDVQQRHPQSVGRAIAVRNRDWTYVWRSSEGPELYDRAKDPHEKENLAGTPQYAEQEQQLKESIFEWLMETSDVSPRKPDARF